MKSKLQNHLAPKKKRNFKNRIVTGNYDYQQTSKNHPNFILLFCTGEELTLD